ncbi:MAG: hypothetical protein A4E55_00790 [Pelotomaculum sp. PtaU1.Bin035]|nr:MAG: hypothetical protein A4E55_00790 [Pelotomaculum sp. PtaU1.Bin035]
MEQLKASLNKKLVLELVNGRIISGTVMAVDQKFVRVGTDEGVGTVPVDAVQIIWEPSKRSLTQENMEHIAAQMRDSVKANLVCYPAPFSCPGTYGCLPPHFCFPNFLCGPAGFSPTPGGSPGCATGYQCTGSFFGIQCTPPGFSQMGGFGYGGNYMPSASGEPVSGQTFCGPFIFRPVCGPFVFGPGCGPFVFGGSTCGTPGGFVCAGAQFFGAPVRPPGMVGTEMYNPALSSGEFSVKDDKIKEDNAKDSKKE